MATQTAFRGPLSEEDRVNTRWFDWIWRVRGSVELSPNQTNEEAFVRLDPLFGEQGTSYVRDHQTLTFTKKDQPAQDRMSIFDSGVLHIEKRPAGSLLRYDLFSRALLFCFLVPLLFLGFAQFTVALGEWQEPPTAAEKAAAEAKKAEKEKVQLPQHPIDKALGAPAPDKPKDKKKDKDSDDGDKPSPTSAYVFAALFALLYVVGRILEAWLVKRLFKNSLSGTSAG